MIRIDKSSLQIAKSFRDKIIDKSANLMWSSGFPATHMLLSYVTRKSTLAKNTIVPLLCFAAAFEIAEEFF
jgi:hypothetical protein